MNEIDDHDKDVEVPLSTDVKQGRRNFLKGSVAAASAGLAAGAVPGLASATPKESSGSIWRPATTASCRSQANGLGSSYRSRNLQPPDPCPLNLCSSANQAQTRTRA